MLNTYEETMYIMKKYHIIANKSLGQNFLINEEVIDSIVETAQITKEDIVVEIGPGLGTLTKQLLEKAKKVIAIELDNRMIEILKERFSMYSNLEIIKEDVLKVNLQEKIGKENAKAVKVVANLPYYITTPIIMKLLEDKLPVESITVMIQKEVAQRLVAIPGTKLSGAISYSVYYYSEPKEGISVPKQSFIPEPKVESQVIKLNLRETPPVKVHNEELFFKIIKTSFMQRRKTLINGLTNSGLVEKELLKQVLREVGIEEKTRGETISIEKFAEIANKL